MGVFQNAVLKAIRDQFSQASYLRGSLVIFQVREKFHLLVMLDRGAEGQIEAEALSDLGDIKFRASRS